MHRGLGTPFLSSSRGDMGDKLGPSVSYLQKLGPEYLDQIFESARWVFEQDRGMVFEVSCHSTPSSSTVNFIRVNMEASVLLFFLVDGTFEILRRHFGIKLSR